MRVLFVLENYIPHIGGAEMVFKNLAEQLVKQGHHVDLITHRLPETRRFEVINGVNVYRVRCFDSRYLFTFFSLPKVIQLARKADVIHTTTFNGAPPAWCAAKIWRKPCVLTVHEVWINRWHEITDQTERSASLHNFLEKMIYRLEFSHYAAVSKATQDQLHSIGIKGSTSVVYNGVEYDHFNPELYDPLAVRKKLFLEDTFVYFTYGRAGPSKGIEYIVKAVPKILKSIPRSKCVLMLSKDTAYKERYNRIKQMIHDMKISKYVIILEPVPWKQLPSYILAADCIVIPSLAEGFCFAAAESAALGKSVVATTAGSLPEVVSGRHVLVQPQSENALADGVVKIYEDEADMTPLKRFSIEDNVRNYLNIYESIKKP
ncbi:MAG TPA: glycosyltransferase family 4 protein [Candidatus Nanoarchaeia archaeon]|nr:glycosyltransferase family 4 protein [Candidatus Nanoarchaeia archaeon]